MKPTATLALTTVGLLLAGCSKLSPEAREITGHYYISEVSPDIALMELNDDATCIMRAVKPGVLTYAVPGTWDLLNDSIIMTLQPDKLTFEGDSTLIGTVSPTIRRRVVGHTDMSLTIENEGIEYTYQRKRPQN